MTGYLPSSAGVSFSSMRVLGSYALVYLTEGGGRYQMRGQAPRTCSAGDLLVVFPEIPHAYGPEAGGHWSEVYVTFEGEIFDLWRRAGILTPERPILRLLPVSRHAKLLRNISEKRAGDDPAKQLGQVCMVQSFLALALEKNRGSDPGSDDKIWPAWVSAAVEQMGKERPVLLEEIARGAGLSYESFRKKFRAVTGVSPARYRNRLVIDRARKMIYEERLSNT
ncbi:MAG: AraC family transcriptional regulator, partial [Verrucomicrobiota bacterium]